MKTCFVIIAYDIKTDFSSGQQYNMESSYENLIKPVFDKLKIECFRAKDKCHSGVIDVHMYKWILEADIVVADLTTWNPNVLYELGVRHAVKPFTTILICDEKARSNKIPFDLGHVSINYYKHLGEDIGVTEARRFCAALEVLVKQIVDRDKEVDSPLYTFLQDLSPPVRAKHSTVHAIDSPPGSNIADLIKEAEQAKSNNDFEKAKKLFKRCLDLSPGDTYLLQRYALVTYKAAPKSMDALLQAEKLISTNLDPDNTTDPETLGLCGAIKKRMFDATNEQKYLDESIKFYARGFYVKQDYYNGINYAFMLTIKADLTDDKVESLGYFSNSNFIRSQVVTICEKLIAQYDFSDRKDKNWVYLTMAEAFLGLGQQEKVTELIPTIRLLSEGPFDHGTFNSQTSKLQTLLKSLKLKYNGL